MRDDEWEFAGEGGKHIVFRYIGCCEDYCGKVLKLIKFSRETDANSLLPPLDLRDSLLKEWFGNQHVPALFNDIILEQEFINGLLKKCSMLRSSRRKKDFCSQRGFFEVDLFTISHLECAFIYEIKIKCGLTSVSPFLTNETLVKKTVNRFALRQSIKDGSISNFSRKYDPSDLCSREKWRIYQAITALMHSGSNHFKCHHLPCSISNDTQRMILTEILSAEKIAEDLELLQGIDMIDIEGANAVLESLMNRMTLEQIEQEVRNYQTSIDPSTLKRFALDMQKIRKGKSIESDDFTTSSPYCCIYTLFDKNNPPPSLHSWLQQLQQNESYFLISIWLISLMAKDISLFFNINTMGQATGLCTSSTEQKVVRVRPIQSLQPGCIEISGQNENSAKWYSWNYNVHIIDIGVKPIQKISQHHENEGKICEAYNKLLNLKN